MPLINIQMIKGRTLEQKRKLIETVTKAVCDSVNVSPEKVRIVITDLELENYSISGKLAIDKDN
ncbi:4-oxalocrotonate tautomerase family protein [Candidatus Megaera venefica]|jgi:4-oxalocrotonate tautomerase|uniref:Tautomerase n=1 Tax=Candidatus Megaera venefica TaxID=2055910 RepID=A0ABU5NCR6_9RICK|nr:2-hydroxymuconate tautomerase [Candidatus Megaera venefica]MEA0970942.1 4-oxalocrotonate tautomerase family protein [Candidatus Megaera venefica]